MAKEAGELATKFLKKPHDLEYEKTFWPFNLLSKKRYDGMLYEDDPEKCKLKSMGNEGRKNIAKKFDVETMCQSNLKEYRRLIKN